MKTFPHQTEATEQGEQVLVPGVAPITAKDRLRLLMEAPMAPRKPQRLCNVGLFDEDARNQIDLFDGGRP